MERDVKFVFLHTYVLMWQSGKFAKTKRFSDFKVAHTQCTSQRQRFDFVKQNHKLIGQVWRDQFITLYLPLIRDQPFSPSGYSRALYHCLRKHFNLGDHWAQRPREVTFHFTIEILDYKTWIYNQKIKVFHEKFAD